MKYRLKKDLPGCREGLIFWHNKDGGFNIQPLIDNFYSIGEFLLGCNLDDEEWFEKLGDEVIIFPTHVSYTGDGAANTIASLVEAVRVLARKCDVEVEIR